MTGSKLNYEARSAIVRDCVTTELAEQWLRYGWGPACAAGLQG